MTISLPFDGPQNLLTFDIALLPVNTITGMGTALTLKSNIIDFDDENNNTIMHVAEQHVALGRDLYMTSRSILNVIDITATGAIWCCF